MGGALMAETASTVARETLGFIGLGIMGRPMARNLLKAGHRLVVHSRSAGPVDELVAAGAERATSPADVARRADVVITMLPDTPDLESVSRGPDGLLGSMPAGALLIDMSTVDPIATRRIGVDFGARGVGYVDAPVSGGERGAIAATLSIMVGGGDPDVARALPIFAVLGTTIVHVGDIGAGQLTKAANQLVVGVTIEAVSEALALAEAAGVDPAKVREAPAWRLGGEPSPRGPRPAHARSNVPARLPRAAPFEGRPDHRAHRGRVGRADSRAARGARGLPPAGRLGPRRARPLGPVPPGDRTVTTGQWHANWRCRRPAATTCRAASLPGRRTLTHTGRCSEEAKR
jgi:3-hydroxyisobutyrate dehydrogenase-like beta-hydroxyacid dehydrogenase